MAQKSVIRKDWYDIIAPDIFGGKKVSETPADEPDKVEGRTVKVNLKEMMPDSGKYYIDVFLKVTDVSGKKARTELVGHKCSREYLSRLVRRHSTRIDYIDDLQTKDNKEIRVKLIVTTLGKCKSSVKKEVRKRAGELVQEKVEESDFDDFMQSIFKNKIQRAINDQVKTTYPLKSVEFRKVEALD